MLRTSRFGRLALSDEAIRTSNWVGLCVLGACAFLAGYFYGGTREFLGCALACGLIIPPLARIYDTQPGWPRAVLSLMTLALGGLAIVITVTLFVGHFVDGKLGQALTTAGLVFFLPFVVGAIAAQFAVNYLVSVQPTRGTQSGQIVWWVGGAMLAVAALLIVGFVGLVVLVGVQDDPVVFDGPIRIKMVAVDDLAWANPAQLDRDTTFFREQGFGEQGDFRTIGLDDVSGRLLYNADEHVWVELTDFASDGYTVAICTVYNDGRAFCYHNLSHDPLAIRPRLDSRAVRPLSE